MFEDDLFRLRPGLSFRYETIAEGLPVLLVDNLYDRPDEIRAAALSQEFTPAPYDYPGKIAAAPRGNRSLTMFLGELLRLVNFQYLPHVPIAADGKRIAHFQRIHTDFAVVDVHPDELTPPQRTPHVDPIPIFALVYLNREERGGTLFFRNVDPANKPQAGPYLTQSGSGFELCGRIEAAFNRLAIYPGFVPHSGEIAGSWIESDERFTNPRLTQRFMFF